MIAPFLANTAPSLDVWSLVAGAGPMAKFVLGVLGFFSVVSWGIIVEKGREFRRAERETAAFMAEFREGPTLAATEQSAARYERAPAAQVCRAGVREVRLNPPGQPERLGPSDLDAIHRILRRSAAAELGELERSLGFLATTASATPFIGLFGTVWGIMNAFRGIGISGTASLAAYAPGIAEALVATAAGLAAAIPAVIAYNHFLGRMRRLETGIEVFIAEFIHRVQGRKL